MKIQKETKGKRKILIITLLVLALVGVSYLFTYFFIFKSSDKLNEPGIISEDAFESDRDQSTDLQNNPDNKDQAPNTDRPSLPDTPAESGKNQVQMVASVDQSNDTIYIRGGINYPAPDGACYALLSGPSNQSIRKESPTLRNPASTDCKTISIPSSELAHGTWTFRLHFTSNEYEGSSGEISFTI